ncbi:tRNA glutamyl-Q(34) synthetase GluQRS [Nocardia sp. NPDC050718]|uniref:tRNA glutamyl-Q(34) synthetase GluQRS n=1 Tax=Nocardia sp. NPDC050718 TaxID=3155788 RepID=UPI0033D132F0
MPTSPSTGAGRYAPSPSGELHLGNLRTAILAWLFARTTGRDFLLRIDDLDRVRPGAAELQLDDLAAIGIDWDGPVVRQSDRLARYDRAIATLAAAGRTYDCFCTRREIQQAATAPHGPMGAYPGTCRHLSDAERAAKRAEGRPAALRLRADVDDYPITDLLHGEYRGAVDDLVLRRGDGIPAYNLTVVVDDAEQGVDQVVRGDDLLPSTPRQAYLAELLGLAAPQYAHVPLVLNAEGKRLAKRDGAVSLSDQRALGNTPEDVVAAIADSLGYDARTTTELREVFDPARIPAKPWILEPIGLFRPEGCP